MAETNARYRQTAEAVVLVTGQTLRFALILLAPESNTGAGPERCHRSDRAHPTSAHPLRMAPPVDASQFPANRVPVWECRMVEAVDCQSIGGFRRCSLHAARASESLLRERGALLRGNHKASMCVDNLGPTAFRLIRQAHHEPGGTDLTC